MHYRPPPRAANCHAHVVGPRARFPVDASHPMLPPDSPAEALFALQDRQGFDRLVIVQSLAHGFDHAAASAAIAMRPDSTRGIALVRRDETAKDLRPLARQGFVGARVHIVSHIPNAAGPEDVARIGALCADLGWHLQVHGHGPEVAELLPVLATLPCPVVIDHMGYPAPDLHEALFHVLDLRHGYAKISCPERVSPELTVGAALAARLIAHAPDKLVWGNDSPHIGLSGVDDDALTEVLSNYPAEALEQILIQTPDRLYFHGDTP